MALLEAAAVEPMGTHHYRAEIADDYTVFGNPNGGYLQCLMANAALAAARAALAIKHCRYPPLGFPNTV